MSLPSTRQLRYFAALAEHLHFGKAAAACFVSQSAFSIAIRELETLLGVRLVDRTNRRVTITALGQEMATQARLCLRDIEALVALAQTERTPLAGPLRLGVIPTIAPFLLPRVLPRLRKVLPKLRLFLHEGTTAEIHGKLLKGELDLLLLALPFDLDNVEVQPLFRDAFRLACRRGTELVNPANYNYSRLDRDSVLLLNEGHCLREHAISACRLKSAEKISPFQASSLLTLIEMVDADLGITFLPEMAEGSALLAGTRVQTYPLPGRNYREIGLAWRQGSTRGVEFRQLGSHLRQLAGSQGPR
ncbi:MAG: hydrogen peroxide-inducible genes activator [Gammaproteobacteria bacterium]|nr:hydrogen peroxide-inducible genes activator [Gammaproteobacteria bacterium]